MSDPSLCLGLLCSTAWNRHPPQSNGIWDLKPSGILFWGTTDPGGSVRPASAEDPTQTWGHSGTQTLQLCTGREHSWKHLQVLQFFPLQRKLCPAEPQGTAAASQQWALVTGTRARHSSAHKVTVSRYQRGYQHSLPQITAEIDVFPIMLWHDPCRIQVRFSSTAPAHWKLWSSDQLCSSAELTQDKYLFPNSPTSKSFSLCQPAVWQELFPALIHCDASARLILVPGREQH